MADKHRRIAARIRRDLDLFLMATPDQVADFIGSGTPRARRLRTSSPLLWLDR